MTHSSLFALLVTLLVLATWIYGRIRKLATPLPPGPPADPIIGNLRAFLKHSHEQAFMMWKHEYGDIVYVNVLGQPMVVLNKYEDAVALLEKRGANYSDRPDCTTFRLMGASSMSSILRYDDQLRSHRRLMQEPLLPKALSQYGDMQHREVLVMLRKLSRLSGDCSSIVAVFASELVFEIAYGHKIMSEDDVYLMMGREALRGLEEGSIGGGLLDLFPFLQYVPPWISGCAFLTDLPRVWRPAVEKIFNCPFDDVRKKMAAGKAEPCFVTKYLEQYEQRGTEDLSLLDDIRGAAASFFLGGFDTTWSTMMTFICAMLMFPEVQHKLHAELDRVVGFARLPDFDDRESMPYLECVLQEVLRWNPVIRIGAPHRSMHDDVYKGMFIPKDTFVFPSAIGMNRDESVYREPYRFYPERFLPRPEGWGEKHLVAAFGFGRRICPGRYFADATIWLAAANIAAVFNITPVPDANGEKVAPQVAFTHTLIGHPEPFDCEITPRSAQAETLFREV